MGVLTDLMSVGAGGSKSTPLQEMASLFKKRKKSRSSSSGGSEADEPTYHRGGKVRKTGSARLRKGEIVLTKGQAREAVKRIRGHRRGRGRGHGRSGKKR